MSLDGRPPIGLGVTSGGNFYGNTEISFSDVLGDKQVNFYVQSVAQFRTTAFTYVNIERRMQYALQGFSEDLFYYGQNSGILYDPSLAPFVSRDLAQIVESQRGATIFGIYPFNRYTRVELSTGYIHLSQQFNDPTLQDLSNQYQIATFGHPLLNTGSMLPLGVSFIQETTIFRDYGPVAGNTFRFDYQGAPRISDAWISRQTIEGDVRHYQRLAANGVFAVRLRGFRSWGQSPGLLYFGGNSELRGYDYLSFDGQKGFFGDAELRFPIIDAALTPFGVVGGLRGVFFVNMGAAGFDGTPFTPFTSKSTLFQGQALSVDASGNQTLVPQAYQVNGFRLVDGRASYGIGLESFLLGFPMHFDFSWKTLFNKDWEDVLFVGQGGSAAFRKMKFNFWIGYDF